MAKLIFHPELIPDKAAFAALCPFGAIEVHGDAIEPTAGCKMCGLCVKKGPAGAAEMVQDAPAPQVDKSAWRGILVYADHVEGTLHPVTFELLGKARELAASIPGSFIPGQFVNPANPAAHYAGTGPEIWRDTCGEVAAFVAGVGTGGTITGAGRFLKEKNSAVYIAAVEPADSPVLSGGKAGPHAIQGIGAGFVPAVLDTGIYDEVLCVETQQAFAAARSLARHEGLLAGISSGAALWAAMQLARRPQFCDKIVVALLPDTGERYLSTGLFAPGE